MRYMTLVFFFKEIKNHQSNWFLRGVSKEGVFLTSAEAFHNALWQKQEIPHGTIPYPVLVLRTEPVQFWLEKGLWTKTYLNTGYKIIPSHSMLFDFLGLRMKETFITPCVATASLSCQPLFVQQTACSEGHFQFSSGALHKETKKMLQASRPISIFSLRTSLLGTGSAAHGQWQWTDHKALLNTEAGPSCSCLSMPHLFLHYIVLISAIGSSFSMP